MNRYAFFPFLIAVCAADARAQIPAVQYASPRGCEFFEGNSSSNIMLGNFGADTRVQQVDNNVVGSALSLVRSIGWRRDQRGGGAASKSVTLTIVMAHGDFATVTSTWATNYKDTPRTVFTKKAVMMPSWAAAATPGPADFDFFVKLDVPFVYNRKDAIVWDVTNSNNQRVAHSQDWHSTSIAQTYGAFPRQLGGACTTANGRMRNDTAFRADASNIELGMKVSGAPSSVPIAMLIGASDPAVSLPNGCGTLHVAPTLVLALGVSDASGRLPLNIAIRAPWQASFSSISLYAQAVAIDAMAAKPLVFSNGVLAPAPQGTGTAAIGVKRLYSTNPSSATGTGPANSACPTVYGF